MVTKTELKNLYGDSMNINTIIDGFDDENGVIVDMSQRLFGKIAPVTEGEAKEMVKVSVEQLCKDLMKKVSF